MQEKNSMQDDREHTMKDLGENREWQLKNLSGKLSDNCPNSVSGDHFLYVCVSACVYLCVHVHLLCGDQRGTSSWVSFFECFPSFPCNRVSHWSPKSSRLGWLSREPKELPVSALPLRGWDYESIPPCSALKCAFRAFNSAAHACPASTLPTGDFLNSLRKLVVYLPSFITF